MAICSMKACPYPAEPGGELCAAHRDLRDGAPGNGTPTAYQSATGRWWRRLGRRTGGRPTGQPPANGGRRPAARSQAEPTRHRLLTLQVQGIAARSPRPVVSPLARQPAPLGVPPTAPTTGRAAKRKMAEKLRALDQPSEGQLAMARRLGIDPTGMGRRQLQQRIEAAQRDSGGRNQEQWLVGVIERELTRRLDALLVASKPVPPAVSSPEGALS